MIRYNIIPVYFPLSDITRYKLRLRKYFLGFIPYNTWEEYFDEGANDWRVKLFETATEAHKYMEQLNRQEMPLK